MNPVMIVQLLAAAAQLARTMQPLVEEGLKVANSEDEVMLKASLAELQAANDQLFGQVQKQLRG